MDGERIGGRQGCIPACHGSALHRTPHPQFHPLHPTQRGVHSRSSQLIYGAINVKQARQEFESSRPTGRLIQAEAQSAYGKTISPHVERLYNYGSAVCKRSCTTNAIESVNSSFQGDQERRFPQRDAVFRFSTYASKSSIKMEGRHTANRAMVGTSCSWTTGCLSYAAIRCCLLNRFTQNS